MAKVDLLTVDAVGGGTALSPGRRMKEGASRCGGIWISWPPRASTFLRLLWGGRVHLQRSDLQGLRALRVLCQADGRVKLMAGHAVRWLRRGLPRTWAKRSGLRSAHLGRAFRNEDRKSTRLNS